MYCIAKARNSYRLARSGKDCSMKVTLSWCSGYASMYQVMFMVRASFQVGQLFMLSCVGIVSQLAVAPTPTLPAHLHS